MIRLFTAVAVPAETGERLQNLQYGVPGARWRPLESLHVTLAFYGEVHEDVARDLDSALSTVSAGPFPLELQGVGAFGDGPDIRAIWAGVTADPGLERLAAACATAARRVGLKVERKTYRPHVTLAYTRRPDPEKVAAWIQSHNLFHESPFAVGRFGLYSSWRTSEGSAYRLEADYRL